MFLRVFASALLLLALSRADGQEVIVGGTKPLRPTAKNRKAVKAQDSSSAWLDLRRSSMANRNSQTAPAWIRAVKMLPTPAKEGAAAKTTFRIQLAPPPGDFQVLSFRLFFDDKAEHRPRIVASDEAGALVLQTPPLGLGLNIATSETIMVPTGEVSTLEVEVPGDGETVRAAFLDWMKTGEVLRPLSGEQRYVMGEAFSGAAPLRAPSSDEGKFGTVTATLAPETIQIGPSVPQGAAFQFGIESQPLAALLTFEVGAVDIDSPPEIYVNGVSLGPVTLTLPELADPGFRGEMKALVSQMRFKYTGWLRAQKMVPAADLRVGTNDLLVVGGSGTAVSAIRATQIQLKYLWEKLDYQLVPRR